MFLTITKIKIAIMRKVLFLTFTLCCFTSMLWAQTRQITGRVLSNESGTAIAGASITVKKSTKGAVTDADGKFTITIPAKGNTILVFNSIGYVSQELTVSNQNALILRLVTENKALEDVVVVGYGSVKKKDLTGAVGTVKSAEIVRANPSRAALVNCHSR
jgi:uncharacterized protein with LGFP repeats